MNSTEVRLTLIGRHFLLPPIHDGATRRGPVAGAHAEIRNDGLHTAWTATRLLAAVMTFGASLALGRKEKGSATLVITYGNGIVTTRKLRTAELGAAQEYVARFNAYAKSLGRLGATPGPAIWDEVQQPLWGPGATASRPAQRWVP